MSTHSFLTGLAAIAAFGAVMPLAHAQGTDRKVRIEISRTENGETSHITREFDMSDEQDLNEALRELGVLEELQRIGDGEDLVIDMRRMKDGGLLDEMSMAMIMDDLAAGPTVSKAYLGVYYGNYNCQPCDEASAPPVKEGCAITSVVEGQAADKAGLQAGDVLVRLNERELKRGGDLVDALRDHKPGEAVKVTYYRGKEKRTANVVLGEQEAEERSYSFNWTMPDGAWNMDGMEPPDMEPRPFLGITGGEADTQEGGVRVGEVTPGSPADAMGLREGDIIRSINGDGIADFNELAEEIGDMEPGDAIELGVTRNGSALGLAGTLGEQAPQADALFVPLAPCMPAPFAMPTPPTPPAPPSNGRQMSPEDRAEYERSMAEYERELAEYTREMDEQARDRYEYDREREEYRREMDELRREMTQLRKDLRREVTREMHVSVHAMALTKEETDLLKAKGVANLDRSLGWTELRIAPNPSNGPFRISFQVPERGDLTVDVHNATGERVYRETITGFKGNYERLLDLAEEPAGAYFLIIGQGDATEARKLVKQ